MASSDSDKFMYDGNIAEGHRHLSQELQAYYILLALCGGRSRQFHKAFMIPPKERKITRIPKNTYEGMVCDLIRFDVHTVSAGPAYADYYYFPAALEKAVRNYTHQYTSKDTYEKRIRSPEYNPGEIEVNVLSLRKWNYEVLYRYEYSYHLLVLKKTDYTTDKKCHEAASVVHGNIGAYLDRTTIDDADRAKRGAVCYSRSAEHLFKVLEIPAWILQGKTGFSPKIKLSDEAREERKKHVIEMLKAKRPDGRYQYSHRTIKAETGIKTREFNKIIAENNLERGNAGGWDARKTK